MKKKHFVGKQIEINEYQEVTSLPKTTNIRLPLLYLTYCIRSYLENFEVEEATTISLIDDEFCCIPNNFTGSALTKNSSYY